MFLQSWDIASPVNADYAKQVATLPGTPHFSFTLTINVSVRRMFYDHTKLEKMKDSKCRMVAKRGKKEKKRTLRESQMVNTSSCHLVSHSGTKIFIDTKQSGHKVWSVSFFIPPPS